MPSLSSIEVVASNRKTTAQLYWDLDSRIMVYIYIIVRLIYIVKRKKPPASDWQGVLLEGVLSRGYKTRRTIRVCVRWESLRRDSGSRRDGLELAIILSSF